jgi:heptose I phosphotransferase
VRNFEFDRWDSGRLTVNRDFSELLRRHALTTCEAIWQFSLSAEPAKALRTDRVTLRFLLTEPSGRERVFYIKRHGRSSWKEHVKPWLQGQRPLLGARPEWEALLAFHRHGLPTMTPVALGKAADRSFLVTEGLEDCRKLSAAFPSASDDILERRRMIARTARIARSMHDSRLHHQDFYLGHLLEAEHDPETMYVIDLGRVRPHSPWFAQRWIVKDLAQLNYSAHDARLTERLRFLHGYLGRKLQPGDRNLVRGIIAKTNRIARHSAKHGL